MRRKHLGANFYRNQPVSSDRHITHQRGLLCLLLLSASKVHGPGKRRHHHELGEGYVRLKRHLHCCIERCRFICREPEDERTKHMDAVLFEGLQLLPQGLA